LSGGIIFNSTTSKLQVYVSAIPPSVDGTGYTSTHSSYDGPAMGQTIQPLSTGKLTSIEGKFAIRTSPGDVQCKIYSSVNGSLIATADNVVNDADSTEGTFVTGTWTFSSANLTLNAGTTYYIEFTATNGNRLFFGDSYSNPYTRGAHYSGTVGAVVERTGGGGAYTGYDLCIIVNYGGASATWSDLH
jgi:hypothetical protein